MILFIATCVISGSFSIKASKMSRNVGHIVVAVIILNRIFSLLSMLFQFFARLLHHFFIQCIWKVFFFLNLNIFSINFKLKQVDIILYAKKMYVIPGINIAINRPFYSKNTNFIIALSVLKFVCLIYYFLDLSYIKLIILTI